MSATTPMERTVLALSHRAPDRTPVFLLPTMHGARELGLRLEAYFSSAENVAEGQLRLRKRFGHDCLYGFTYAAVETEAFGQETLFVEDGPPNAGPPVLKSLEDINQLEVPSIEDSPSLMRGLAILERLKQAVGTSVPIVGVALSPYSLPILQLGLGAYLDLLLLASAEQPGGRHRMLLELLLGINEVFTTRWGRAQFEAGATCVTYFDPMSSTTMTPRAMSTEYGLSAARRVFSAWNAPSALHFASGRALALAPQLLGLGAAVLGVSAEEDLALWRGHCAGKLTLLGNLNALAMVSLTLDETEEMARAALLSGTTGGDGGFILGDNHGELPLQLSYDHLHTIMEVAKSFDPSKARQEAESSGAESAVAGIRDGAPTRAEAG